MDAMFYTFSVLMFAAVFLLIEGAYLWWSGTHGGGARRIARRLRTMSGGSGGVERVSILKQRRYSNSDWLDAFLHRRRLINAIDLLLVQSGTGWSLALFLGVSAAAMALGLMLVQMRSVPLLLQVLAVALLTALPYFFVVRARSARLAKVEQQLPEVADFLARAMRAGHSFSNVLQMVGSEMPEPISGEFRVAHEEINYGVSMNEALYNLADRIPLTDLRYLIIAVVIQRESGGNLAEILGNISELIRQRLKLLAKVRVLSAEGRMSAWVLGMLPIAVGLLMTMVNYTYISILWTNPVGIKMLSISGVLIVVGVIWIRGIVRIRV